MPHRKTSIEKPATSTTVNVARGLVPRYGLPPAGNGSDEPSGFPTNTNDPHTSPILPTKLAGGNNEYLVKSTWKNTCTIP